MGAAIRVSIRRNASTEQLIPLTLIILFELVELIGIELAKIFDPFLPVDLFEHALIRAACVIVSFSARFRREDSVGEIDLLKSLLELLR